MDEEQKKAQGENPNPNPKKFDDPFEEETVAIDMETFSVAPGETPVMTGLSRSNIEQAAAEQAARKALEEEERKKNNPAIIVGAVVAFIIIVVSAIFVVILLNDKKDDPMTAEKNKSSQGYDDDSDESLGEVKRVGSAEHGYVDVPKAWKKVTAESLPGKTVSDAWVYYEDSAKKNGVMLDSYVLEGGLTAEQFANGLLREVQTSGSDSQKQLITEKHGDRDMYKVYSYAASTKIWTIHYVFEGDDGRVHYIGITSPDSAALTFESVPNSWSPNKKK